MVKIYDSLEQGANSDVLEQICSILQCQGTQLEVVNKPVQKQIKDYCGLFAIANALTLAQGKNPCMNIY